MSTCICSSPALNILMNLRGRGSNCVGECDLMIYLIYLDINFDVNNHLIWSDNGKLFLSK